MQHRRDTRVWNGDPFLIELLKPTLRTFVLSFLLFEVPRCYSSLRRPNSDLKGNVTYSSRLKDAISSLTHGNKVSLLCTSLVGGFKILRILFRLVLNRFDAARKWRTFRIQDRKRSFDKIPHFLAAFTSAWLCFRCFSCSKQPDQSSIVSDVSPDERALQHARFKSKGARTRRSMCQQAGGSIDWTLFLAVRALDSMCVKLWRQAQGHETNLKRGARVLARQVDATVFAVSSGLIMWAWFYLPERLPDGYNRWIGHAAQVDRRLIQALRMARAGTWIYGEDKGERARLLEGMCEDYRLPRIWGNPQKTIPIPCSVVHMGIGNNCHHHAILRLWRAFKFAIATNLPLQILVKAVSKGILSRRILLKALRDAVRSSAFLGSFVALMYYGICLSRTLVGPNVCGNRVSSQEWESGLCVKVACVLCGLSIFIEKEKRRGELALFVAPRALATLLPRRYDLKHIWMEQLAFSTSIAILFTVSGGAKNPVRGMFGKLLKHTLYE